jgi:hypothetical protein
VKEGRVPVSRHPRLGRAALLAAPTAFGWVVPLGLFVINAGEVEFTEVVPILAAVALVTVVLQVIARKLVRAGERLDPVLGLAWLLFFFYRPLIHRPLRELIAVRHSVVLLLLAVLLATLSFLAVRARPKTAAVVASAMAATAYATICVQLFSLVPHHIDLGRPTASVVSGVGSDPSSPRQPVGSRPDVFVVFLDGFSGGEGLQQVFGYDPSDFYQRLEKQGFRVAHQSQASYDETICSIPSILGLEDACHPLIDRPWGQAKRYLAAVAMHLPKVARLFAESGYTIVAVETSTILKIRHSSIHTLSYFYGAAYHHLLLWQTPISYISALRKLVVTYDASGNVWDPESIRWSFARIEEVMPGPKPTLILAHIFLPHQPFYFDADGNVVTDYQRQVWDLKHKSMSQMRAAYLDQVRFLERRVVALTSELIARRPNLPPVVLLVGDHGPRWALPDGPADRMADGLILSRFSALNAVLAPEPVTKSMSDCISPANSMILVANGLLGLTIPLQPEKSYHVENSRGNSGGFALEEAPTRQFGCNNGISQ